MWFIRVCAYIELFTCTRTHREVTSENIMNERLLEWGDLGNRKGTL
jgi:hypothetical protein